MRLQEYKGRRIVTVETISEYALNRKDAEKLKGAIYRQVGPDNYFNAPMNIAVQYGQKKNFNYSRGLRLYDVNAVMKTISEHLDYYSEMMDTEAFADDVARNNMREMPDEVRNKPRAIPVKKTDESLNVKAIIKKPIQKPEAQIEDRTINLQVGDIQDIQVKPTSLPIDEVYAMLDTQAELHATQIGEMRTKVDSLIETVQVLLKKIEDMELVPEPKPEIKNEEPITESVFDSPILLKEDATFDEWHKGIKRAVGLIRKYDNRTDSAILKEAYDRLRNQYTIVWEQEAKEFKQEFGRGPVNTRELCWWMESRKPNCKNLLIGKLNTMYSEARRNAAKAV